MQIIDSYNELREQLSDWRVQGDHIALVPTMGNLHEGHTSLVKAAREHAEKVIVSVYVNPTQFGPDEDFEQYPRTVDKDTVKLRRIGADVLFLPDDETIYPYGIENATVVTVPGLTENFCGATRPGHFDGVTTVVSRFFSMVVPDVAVFGQKDYQQQLVIRHMTTDLRLPIRIITAPTVRDADGLAKSSRNQYLDETEREKAPLLYAALLETGEQLQAGKREFEALEKAALDSLSEAGFRSEYFAIRRAANLEIPDRDCDELVVLAAAWLGKARLIDNIVVTI